jgi:hypothetical protein
MNLDPKLKNLVFGPFTRVGQAVEGANDIQNLKLISNWVIMSYATITGSILTESFLCVSLLLK